MDTPRFKLPVGGDLPTPEPSFTEVTIGTDKFNVNANGDAIGADGVVLKTKAELEALKTPIPPVKTPEEIAAETAAAEKTASIDAQLIEGAEIELDGVTHKLTKDGTIVDATGKVLKTKEELKILLLEAGDTGGEEGDLDYVSEIQKVTNLTILDDKGNPVTYENTVPGLAQYAQDVHLEGRKVGASQFENKLLTKYPQLPSILEHLEINGSLKGFTEDVDYNKITIGEDETQHIDIFTKAKLAQGISEAEIKDMIGYYRTDKKLKVAAETGLTYLKQSQTTANAERAAQVAETRAASEQQATKYWNEVNQIVTSKQLVVNDKKFVLPEVIKIKDDTGKIVTKTLNDFQDYIQKPLNFRIDGQIHTMTQLQYDEILEDTKRTPHHDLFDAYRKFTKYDDSQLIAANVNSQTVKKIIKLTSKAGSGGSGATGTGGKIVLPLK